MAYGSLKLCFINCECGEMPIRHIYTFLCFVFRDYALQKRFQNDMVINNSPVEVLQDQKWATVPWKKLQVGDIVRVCMPMFVIIFSCK